jgi:hypothetical protein
MEDQSKPTTPPAQTNDDADAGSASATDGASDAKKSREMRDADVANGESPERGGDAKSR